MKHRFPAALLLALVLLPSCRNNEKEIATVAYGYLDAMGNYRIDDARPYASDETNHVTLDFFAMMMQHTDPAVYADNMPATITLGDITVDDSLATVAFHKSTPTVEQDGTLQLVRRGGHWQVHQVIDVPSFLKPQSGPRQFSDEELAAMRRNGARHVDSMSTTTSEE